MYKNLNQSFGSYCYNFIPNDSDVTNTGYIVMLNIQNLSSPQSGIKSWLNTVFTENDCKLRKCSTIKPFHLGESPLHHLSWLVEVYTEFHSYLSRPYQ